MEPLQRLTRRQLHAMQAIARLETPERGAPLNHIASALRLTAPSALGHVTTLEALHLVVRHRGKSRLTEKGRGTLVEFQRHHRVTETLFGGLGLAPTEICAAAREIDLVISHHTIEQICRAQNHPTTCPHGEPIPPCPSSRTTG